MRRRDPVPSRSQRPRWLWPLVALDAAAAAIGLYLLRPHRVCTGCPPNCVDLHPRWGLLRFLVLLLAAVIASVLFAVARVEEARKEAIGEDPRGRSEGT